MTVDGEIKALVKLTDLFKASSFLFTVGLLKITLRKHPSEIVWAHTNCLKANDHVRSPPTLHF